MKKKTIYRCKNTGKKTYNYYCNSEDTEVICQLIRIHGGRKIKYNEGSDWFPFIQYQADHCLSDEVSESFKLYEKTNNAINGTA